MPFSNYLDQKLLQYAFGNVAWTPPATVYVGLSSSQPTQVPASNWNVTEPSGNGYARPGIANNDTSIVAVGSEPTAGYEVTIATAVTFTESTGPWLAGATLGYFVLFDAATGGNVLAYGPLNPPIEVPGAGYLPDFPANQLTTSLT